MWNDAKKLSLLTNCTCKSTASDEAYVKWVGNLHWAIVKGNDAGCRTGCSMKNQIK